MKKRFFSVAFAVALVFALFAGTALAVESRVSPTLAQYPVSLERGDRTGEVKIVFSIRSSLTADSLGVSSITIYRKDGANDTYVTTIQGSTGNGLITGNTTSIKSSYVYSGTSGTTYFADVTVFASIGSDYDSRTVRTDPVTAP